MKALGRVYERRFPTETAFSKEQARELAALSHRIKRQIGVIINRRGQPVLVVVGDHEGILIPELERYRSGASRLSGLRLVHTHLNDTGLSEEDLMDLVFLRLDSICVLTITSEGFPSRKQWAHLLPPNSDQAGYRLHEMQPWTETQPSLDMQIQSLEEELARENADLSAKEQKNCALLVSVSTKPVPRQEISLKELSRLSSTAGLNVVGTMTQRVTRINPKHILGKGKLAEMEVLALQKNAGIIVFDQELSPSQLRNLTRITERRVLDRTQLILDIFAQHAHSKQGQMQVELAQLKYTLPRLVGRNRALSRLAGGIGGRGPGETKLEMDKRRIRDRITRIGKELKKIRKQRETMRTRRRQAGLPVISLVGYTNAGKSTLLNVLTGSEVSAENKLFATLDPASRRLRFPRDREVILTDTVGFIHKLPDELRKAFMATLEELYLADMLILVADAAHPDADSQIAAVKRILEELGLQKRPLLLAMNKADRLETEKREQLERAYPEAVFISARNGDSLEELVHRADSMLNESDSIPEMT
ncbi:MAG: GTPase HflX [Desulfonatronovibrionaceae bacterium]